ncbi:MAG: phenylalanine--tRNA ligase beta subunit-related protein [Thalassobaculum sp.]|uniref:B3/B4 domain-containing protein n=1 Tax=Thalassobaculum sp. TaxID=2022740 RepID=UPI0032F02B22
MRFSHSSDIWRDFPELAAGALFVEGIDAAADVAAAVDRYGATARSRLDGSTEGELPEIQAWRRAFSRMGLKPTQYRCASEALLRRFRKEGALPRLHPLVDLCNALSLATAIPVAVLDVARIAGSLQVRYATGSERYLTFGGETENPAEGEVVFADADGNAHARRWTNRQSGLSAVRDGTRAVLIVAEAMHDTARADVESLLTALSAEIATAWQPPAATAILGPSEPEFGF